ncbi:MAG: hypothetical protein JWN12_408 [Candidatus Saccharibacteria bacterium]|nr:hypothetical protein [Candidatus Saccharibacteria bacterium]
MARLPTPGADKGTWGGVLNDYLSQSLKTDGSIKDGVINSTHIADGTVLETKLSSAVQTKLNATAAAPDWSTIANKPAVIASGADQASARTAIGAGTSNLAIGTTSTTAAAGNDSRIINAADAQTARAFPSTSGVIALDCSLAYVWSGTVTGSFSFNLINLPVTGTVVELLVKVTQDSTGSRSFTGWTVNGSSVTPTYDTGTATPVAPAANTTTVLNIMTTDAGATLLAQGATPKLDITLGDYQAVGVATTTGSTGLAADAGHTHQGVTQLIAGANVTITGGDSNGHGVLTVASAGAGGGGGNSNPAPADQSLVSWSYDVAFAGSSGTVSTGVLFLQKLTVSTASTATNIICGVSVVGATLTAGQNLCGLYSISGMTATLIAQTSDQSTNWTSVGMKTMALTASQSLSAGHYYVGFLVVGTTSPTFIRTAALGIGATGVNIGTAAGTYRQCIYGGSYTALPATLSLASSSTSSAIPWAGIS